MDTGADYTLLPKGYAQRLDIDLKKDCKIFKTTSVGGQQKSYILLEGKVKIGSFERTIPIGFLEKQIFHLYWVGKDYWKHLSLFLKIMKRFLERYENNSIERVGQRQDLSGGDVEVNSLHEVKELFS